MSARVQEIEDGVFRLRVRSPGGLVANVYALKGNDEIGLIDTGFPYTVDALGEELKRIGTTWDEIDHILYTHTHVDHLGGGAALGDAIDATQHVYEGTPAEALTDYFAWYGRHRPVIDVLPELLPSSSTLRAFMQAIGSQPEGELRTGAGFVANAELHAFDDVVEVAGRRLRCVDLRGHDPYHCGWLEESSGMLFSGDSTMRVVTPLMPNMDDDLPMWLRSMTRIRALDVSRILPGHGLPTTLIDASLERSECYLQSIYDIAFDELIDGLPVDPLVVANTYLGDDRSQYNARLAVFVGTTYCLFEALADLELVRKQPDNHWVMVRDLPSWPTVRARLAELKPGR